MEQLFLLLVSTCLAWGLPVGQEEVNQGFIGGSGGLVLSIADDEQQSVAVLNLGNENLGYEKIVEMEVNHGDNYVYDTRHFDQGGGYQFGYDSYNVKENEAQHFKHELMRADGTVLGRYGYRDPNGKLRVTNYVSDKDGFQVLQPGVLVQLEPVDNNSNVRARSNLVDDEPEAGVPIVHAAIPPGAQNLQNGVHSYGYFLAIR